MRRQRNERVQQKNLFVDFLDHRRGGADCGRIFGKIDSFWSGMGGALIGVGIVQTIRWAHYWNDPEYKEKFDTQTHDERNRFIANKAWAWAGYLSVLTGAAAAIAFKIAGMDDISYFCSIAVCLLMILYWICWLVLKRKY